MGTSIRTKQTPIVEHSLDIARIIFYPNIVIAEIKEGTHVTFENASFPMQITTEFYGADKPFVYISHRLHSYSIDPIGFREVAALFPNLKALGIVEKKRRKRMLANLERLFLKKPIRVFDNLEDAIFLCRT